MARVFVRARSRIGTHPAGDVFEVPEREARLLCHVGRAEPYKDKGEAPPKPKPPEPKPEPAPRQDYQTTNVTETESASVEELRSQYRRRFGQEPDGRWGVPRLTQELGG